MTPTYVHTHSGRMLSLIDPQPEDITLLDLAHGLSHVCRYSGQTRQFYSVAEHSILVSGMVPIGLRLAGLLHDACEAYVTDIPAPLKQFLPQYKEFEERVQSAIDAKFGIKRSDEDRDVIKISDVQVRLIESGSPKLFLYPFEEYRDDSKIYPLSSSEAKSLFIEKFNYLSGLS